VIEQRQKPKPHSHQNPTFFNTQNLKHKIQNIERENAAIPRGDL